MEVKLKPTCMKKGGITPFPPPLLAASLEETPRCEFTSFSLRLLHWFFLTFSSRLEFRLPS